MNLYIFKTLTGEVNLLDTYESLIWNIQFFDFDDFELVVAGTERNVQLLSKGSMIVRESDYSHNTRLNVMMITNRRLSYDTDKGWTLTVSGKGLKYLLNRRIIWSQTTATGQIEAIIRQLIIDNVIDPADPARAISDFVLGSEAGITEILEETEDQQLSGEKLGDWINSICVKYSIGYRLDIINNQFVFNLITGTDRTYEQNTVPVVVFSPDFDNLISSDYEENYENYVNAAIVGGEGEGADQRLVSIGTAEGLERYESYIDGSGVSSNGEIITLEQYYKLLEDYGNEEMAEMQASSESFSGEIVPNGMFDYGIDYFLGDLVQIKTEYGISLSVRITEVIESEDDNGNLITVTFSTNERDE